MVRADVSKLPPGFRFHPTDEELVVLYLRRKVFSWPLPADVIPEIDITNHDPWSLPGGVEGEKYFFYRLEKKYAAGNRSIRATCSGYWKTEGKEKPVLAFGGTRQVGMKKVFVFHQAKHSSAFRTNWIMHEYRHSVPESTAFFQGNNYSTAVCKVKSQSWLVCRIFNKSRDFHWSQVLNSEQGGDHDLIPRSPSSSYFSCITDISSDEENSVCSTEETSSPTMSP